MIGNKLQQIKILFEFINYGFNLVGGERTVCVGVTREKKKTNIYIRISMRFKMNKQ